ncbi:unnamed protein product [Caenorhabditis bovis]|uniref:Uncharacterized protein n=1 Tax=Caenorhabditis bovis TaxID=2654633 RepID=A0A8S1EZ31_9PELO|nr:unnamed protein product [Caenorhabditis bovis]
MASPRICTSGLLAMVIYLLVILIPFIALIAYASYSFHIFIPIAPSNEIDCQLMADNSSDVYQEYLANRTTIRETPPDRSCFQIKKRRYLPNDLPKSLAGFHNLIFIRVVTKDYDFIEEVLTMMHSPIHFFCYSIDKSADEKFKKRMFYLGDCLMNVMVIRELFDTSTSHGMLNAQLACMKTLDSFEWKHAIITAERDIPLHSTKFLSRRSRRLRDMVEMNGITFKEDALINANASNHKTRLYQVTKNWLQHMGSMATISHTKYEKLYKYLLATPDFKLPTYDHRETTVVEPNCLSERYDIDGSCMYTMESFRVLRNFTRLFIRADPNFDFGFVQCVHEVIFDRTFLDPISNSNANNYIWGSGVSSISDYRP